MRFYLSLILLALVVFFGLSYLAYTTTAVKVNINTASREELIRLPGIGERLADKIIKNRPIRSMQQLAEIEGIGEQRIRALEGKVIFP